jgi:peptidoglycan/xylan/chitin deacetylase (PgdA/CDA1 family)
LLTAEARKELASLGVEIGSHSRTHREMPLLDDVDVEFEARGSADDMAASGLPRPRFFAYPFGALDDRSKTAVREARFRAAFGLKQRRLSRASDLFDLPRVIVLATDRGLRFRLKTAAPVLFNWYVRAGRAIKRRLG